MARIVYSTCTNDWRRCDDCGAYFESSGFDDGLAIILCPDCETSSAGQLSKALDDLEGFDTFALEKEYTP